MKENYFLEWQDIPEKSEAFSCALKEILGRGAVIVEDLIVENLYKDLGKELFWRNDFTFTDYITNLNVSNKPILCTSCTSLPTKPVTLCSKKEMNIEA